MQVLNILDNLKTPELQKWKETQVTKLRPWSEFFNRSKFIFPEKNYDFLLSRISKNLDYFQTNYLLLFIGLLVYSILTNPWLVIIGVCSSYSYYYLFYLRKEPLVIKGREITDFEKTTALGIITIIGCLLGGIYSTICWLLGFTILVILIHAIFYKQEDLSINL
eukprot:TRINITY_DN7713_c0_g2_i1.p1 TRINITY_DN7713_c0_g2~~TRINITY_DN7713_c0_g2_i1.p1  ORF type:complete len:164 (-),score=44.36 TRINITY_DN7713_c0_g2_i1:86-577(-)